MNGNEKKRIIWLFGGIALLFALLVFQFAYIQIFEGKKWREKAKRQHFFVAREPFKRGIFYSNAAVKKGHPQKPERFVVDVQKFHLHADPLSIPEEYKKEIAKEIAKSIPEADFLSELNKPSRDRLLAMWLEREKKDEILQWWNGYAKKNKIARNALFFVPDYQRSYPFGKLLGQVLHTVQERRDEETGQSIPTGGLELAFHSYLQGKTGKRLLMRSPRHSLEYGELLEEPKDGADIYLTINHYLQAICEEEIEKGVQAANAKGGWAVMIDPHTGEILAFAEYPFFYPEKYREYFNDPKAIEGTKLHAITEAYEPGSVMKPFGIALALMTDSFDPAAKIPCSSGDFPGRTKPITDVGRHSFLNLDMGMQKSSNIYMARVAEKVIKAKGDAWYREKLSSVFGFGEKTGIELPGESPGVLPTPGKLHANGKSEWSKPTPYSIAMGYNIQVSSIQLLRAWSVLANGGKLVDPTLIKKIVDGDKIIVENEPVAKQVIDPAIIQKLKRAMRFTTLPGGTATRANIPGFTEVVKSGTARKIKDGEYSSKHHIASLIGFAPADNPAFVLLVTLDEPEVKFVPGVGYKNHGGVAAAPVFCRIGTRTLEYLGVTPDDPYGFSQGDPRYDPNKMKWMSETRSLREKYETWNK